MSTPFLTSCCRVCLAQENIMVYVFDKVEQYNMSLSELLEICGDIKINSDDQYTKLICKDCTTELLMVAKFRWKCKTSEGTLTQLTAMEPSDLHKLDVKDANDDCTSLPDHTFVDRADLNNDETDIQLELSKPAPCIEEIISPIADDISEPSSNEYDDAGDGELETVFLKREVYEEIEYLQSDAGKNEGQQPVRDQLHYVLDDTGNSEAVQYIILQSPSENDDDCLNDVVEHDQVENDVRDQSEDENVSSHSDKEQYEIIISDVVDYDGVSNEAVLPNDDYIGNDDVRVLSESSKVVINHNCDICGAGFMHLSNLKKHLLSHKDVGFVCPVCSLVFTDGEKCNLHHQRAHPQEVQLTQSNAKNVMQATKKTTKSKIATTSLPQNPPKGDKRKTHRCPHCDKWFVSNSMLAAHVRVHTGERPYSCSQCTKTFTTRGGLELHVRRHMGVKPFECSICSRRFVESSNLRVHMRIHTGEKPHKCNHCGRSFARVFLLQIHQRTHTGERPYSCPTCNKAFAQQGDLSAHKRIHSGERPHICSICNKGFIKSSALTAHMRRHEKNSKFEAQADDDGMMDCIEDDDDDETDIRQKVRIEFGTRRSD